MPKEIKSKFRNIFKNANMPNPSVVEEQGYLISESNHIFYFMCAPRNGSKTGIVLCSPFGEEKVRTARIFVSIARILASLGITALCFDYFGDGDSEGNFEDATYDNRVKNIETAYDFLKNRNSIEKTGLLGLRWGGTIAALTAEELSPEFLILWDPIIDTAKYFNNSLRLNIASQALIWGKVKKNRDILIKELEAGESVIIEGFPLTGNFYVRAVQSGLNGHKFRYEGKTLIVQISNNSSEVRKEIEDLAKAYRDSEIHSVDKEFEWDKSILWEPTPPQLFETTLAFLEKNEFI